ncbi:MAG TPA: CARDB domain-containing protein [Isosphaeraceae bacterium]|nr:CARDB domain-containing protein [Isosphaeraceae bacterium]
MLSHDRRAAGRRRAWGRGPIILKLESLERRELLTATSTLPDLVNSSLLISTNTADWNDTIGVSGRVKNQGGSTTTAPFEVEIYASPVRGIDKYSVSIAEVEIPAGLAAGQSIPYQTSVQIPASPVPYVSSTGGTLYITASVNPTRTVTESNYRNNSDLGPPYDTAPLVIAAPKPADLVGTTLAVTPTDPTWGSTISVTAQITNQGSGSSPQTRALITLTPQGIGYGGWTTVGVGNIIVPPLGPYQTTNLVQTITLPAVEPLSIANYTNFTLAMTQDADYLTNDLYPNSPTQGAGYDQAAITVTAPTTTTTTTTSTGTTTTTSTASTAATGPLPDLAASSVLIPKSTLSWGTSVQISTEIQNLGLGAVGPFTVRFLLTGANGSSTDSVFLGDTTISGLAAGANQDLTQTLNIPSRAPSGLTLDSVGYARIAVIVDPENFINETLKSNNESLSAPFVLRLPGNATSVPTAQVADTLPSLATVAAQAQHQAKLAAAARRAARIQASHPNAAPKKLKRHAAPKLNSLLDKSESVAKEVSKLPTQIYDALKKSF